MKQMKQLPNKRPREFLWKNNETDLFNVIDTQLKKGTMKLLKWAVDRNADKCKSELETIKKNKKLEKLFAKMKVELKAINSIYRRDDLEDSIIEITQSEQQIERLMG